MRTALVNIWIVAMLPFLMPLYLTIYLTERETITARGDK
jgi:hypothetical protein